MKRIAAMLAFVLVPATAAVAHDTWIMTKETIRSTAPFEISSGMYFPTLDTGPKADRVAGAGWRLRENAGRFADLNEGAQSLTMSADFEGEGTAVVWVAFKPNAIDLEEDEVDEYLEEIGAPEHLRRTWETAGEDRKWHETYTKYAKTFVAIGDAGEDASCIAPIGTAVELVPLRDPTTVSSGEELVIRVLKKGYAAEGQAVVAQCCKSGERTVKYANKSGHVTFEIDSAGPWLFSATELRLQSDGTWTSDFTTMSFTTGGK